MLVVSVIGSGFVAWRVTTHVLNGGDYAPRTQATSTQMTTSTSFVLPASPFIPPIALGARRGESIFPSVITERKLPSIAFVVRDAALPAVKERAPFPSDRLVAAAVAMSADGWFMTTDSFLARVRAQDCSIVWNGTAYTPTAIVRDTYTGVLFFKIPVTNLPASGIAPRTELGLGTPVWLESQPNRLQFLSIDDIRGSSVAPETAVGDVVTRRYIVHASNELPLGAPVWDGSGRLVGFVEGGGSGAWRLVPAHVAHTSLSALLSGSKITHATLGVHSVLDELFIVGASSTIRVRGGVLLAPDRRGGAPAVTRKGPSDGKLKEGDVIERVEHEVLDGSVELAELLLEYPPGTQLLLHGYRNGVALQTTVTLGSLETGVVLK